MRDLRRQWIVTGLCIKLNQLIFLRATLVLMACSMDVVTQLYCLVKTILMKSVKTSCLLLNSIILVDPTPVYKGGW